MTKKKRPAKHETPNALDRYRITHHKQSTQSKNADPRYPHEMHTIVTLAHRKV